MSDVDIVRPEIQHNRWSKQQAVILFQNIHPFKMMTGRKQHAKRF